MIKSTLFMPILNYYMFVILQETQRIKVNAVIALLHIKIFIIIDKC